MAQPGGSAAGSLRLAAWGWSSAAPPAPAAARGAARRALRRMGTLSVEDVGAALEDPDPSARAAACALAVDMADVDVTALLDDVEPQVVEVAAWALGERGDASAVSRLSAVARSHD